MLQAQLDEVRATLDKKKLDFVRDVEVEQYRLSAAKEDLDTSEFVF